MGGAKRAENWNWPTEQMTSRGQPEALAVGLLIALPSGVGVALSKTDDGYAGGLVGVAISASLLPPAVNAGICWGLAPFSADAKELGTLGGYSLLLTIVNIVAIIFAGSLVSYLQKRKHHAWSDILKISSIYIVNKTRGGGGFKCTMYARKRTLRPPAHAAVRVYLVYASIFRTTG